MDRRAFLLIGGGSLSLLGGCTDFATDPASIQVAAVDHADELDYGESIEVGVVVRNEGDEEGSTEVIVRLEDVVVGAEEITLAGGERADISFNDSTASTAGYRTLSVETSDDEYESRIRVSEPEPAELVLTYASVPRRVSHDDRVDATVEVENTGDETARQTVTLSVEGEILESREVMVKGGETEEISFQIGPDTFFSGQYSIDFETEDDTSARTINIENPNPYDKETLVVGLEQNVPARHDIDGIVRNALEYWERNAAAYAGYPIEYEYRPNASNPDVQIILVEEIRRCGNSTGDAIAGCAPHVQQRAPSTAEIKLVDGYRKEWMTTVLKHELGHTLGLAHGDEPAHIMSDDVEDRIPDYNRRKEAVERYTDSFEPFSEGHDALSKAIEAFGNREYAASESHAIDAYNRFETARRLVLETRRIASRLGESNAYDRADESSTHLEKLRLAAEETIEMAREAAYGGDPEPHRKAAMQYLEEAERYTFHDSNDIIRDLGLPVRE